MKKYQLNVDDALAALLAEARVLSDRRYDSEVIRDAVKAWVLRLRAIHNGQEDVAPTGESSRERALRVVAGSQSPRREG